MLLRRLVTPFCNTASIAMPRTCLALLLALSAPAWAINITVDVLGDPVPNGCTPGDCSLREAINLANALAGPDRILLPATPGVPLQLSIPGDNENANATGDLDVLDDLEIIGAGVDTTILVQTAQDRVFHTVMPADKRLTLRGLTVQGGSAVSGGALNSQSLLTIEDAAFVGNDASFEGGAILHRGLYAPTIIELRLVLRRVRFENNVSTQTNNSATGGALHATTGFDTLPYLLIEDCEFRDNLSKSGGGAIYLSGSINYFGGTATIRGSRFIANRTGDSGGAALLVTSSSIALRVEDTLFDANVTTGNTTTAAGAVNLERVLSAALLRTTFSSNSGVRGGALRSSNPTQLVDSYLLDNTATLGGGAVWGGSSFLVDRSTFRSNNVTSTNSADNGGGAIGFAGTELGIDRSTFSGNDAYRGGVISHVSGRLHLYRSTLVAPAFGITGRQATAIRFLDEGANNLSISNTILSGTCTYPNGQRQLAAAYNNIESPGSSCRFTTATINGQNQVSATSGQINLAPLADNGGPTPTRILQAGSIALNQGSETYCSPTDQRHFARTDPLCDVGAVEMGAIQDELFINGFD